MDGSTIQPWRRVKIGSPALIPRERHNAASGLRRKIHAQDTHIAVRSLLHRSEVSATSGVSVDAKREGCGITIQRSEGYHQSQVQNETVCTRKYQRARKQQSEGESTATGWFACIRNHDELDLFQSVFYVEGDPDEHSHAQAGALDSSASEMSGHVEATQKQEKAEDRRGEGMTDREVQPQSRTVCILNQWLDSLATNQKRAGVIIHAVFFLPGAVRCSPKAAHSPVGSLCTASYGLIEQNTPNPLVRASMDRFSQKIIVILKSYRKHMYEIRPEPKASTTQPKNRYKQTKT
ncbi:hypothetical protein BKA62DRAFT_676888 [Auriculariales sp. MPI-PUGE-AT-0066]|nr:hypothetical protein BKA62DRAFT_676888 [Auriculariales sp. MPI-PUGE-AT-0066]